MNYKGKLVYSVSSQFGMEEEVLNAIKGEFNSAQLFERPIKGPPTPASKGPHNLNKKYKYFYNVVSSFDIEFSSAVTIAGERIGVMYHWQWLIGNTIFTGRDWDSFRMLAVTVAKVFFLGYNVTLHVFVHNLSCEFQFLKTKFNFIPDDIFVRGRRDVLNALCEDGFYFRDSYAVSDESLENTVKSLHISGLKKLEYDYDKVRCPDTLLSRDEYEYCINDVYLVGEYIHNLLKKYSYVIFIPVTLTSMAKSDLRKAMSGLKGESFKRWCSDTNTHDLEEYHHINWALHGGFTHSKYHDDGGADGYSEITYNVHSRDAMSFYPSQLVLRKFPKGAPKRFDGLPYEALKNLYANDDTKFVIAEFNLFGVFTKNTDFLVMQYNHVTPCDRVEGGHNDDLEEDCLISKDRKIIQNNRVFWAEKVGICCTLQDMMIYERYYDIQQIDVGAVFVYSCEYLPTMYVRYILSLFKAKESAKTEREREYAKQILNSLGFGVNAMNPCRDEFVFNEASFSYEKKPHNFQKELDKYSRSSDVTCFIFSVALTAFARWELFSLVAQMYVEDVIYIDTDGIKFVGDYDEIFDEYNQDHAELVKYVATGVHRLAQKYFWSEKKQGYIGQFMKEPDIKRMRALSTKKYIMEQQDGKIVVKVSGLPKAGQKNYNFDNFLCDEDVKRKIKVGDKVKEVQVSYLTPEESGRVASVYISHPVSGVVKDWRGVEHFCSEDSCIYMEPVPFSLNQDATLILDAMLTRELNECG